MARNHYSSCTAHLCPLGSGNRDSSGTRPLTPFPAKILYLSWVGLSALGVTTHNLFKPLFTLLFLES